MNKIDRLNPPKTRMVFNVGIAGHIKLDDADIGLLTQKMDFVLQTVKNAVEHQYSNMNETGFYSSETPLLRLFSMLAEGSDRIAAKCALKHNYILQCPLPMNRELYKEDFKTQGSCDEFDMLLTNADSILEIDACSKNKNRAYQNGGFVMLGHTDVLIAVWNGIDSGMVGGTYDIIEYAKGHDIPIVWINSKSPHEILFLYGNEPLKEWKAELENAILNLLVPSDKENTDRFLRTYLNESATPKSHAGLYKALLGMLSFSSKDNLNDSSNNSSDESMNEFYTSHYFHHYDCADTLATFYRDQYRSCGVIRQLLPFLASIGLALGFYAVLFGGPNGPTDAIKPALTILSSIGFLIQAVCFVLIIITGKVAKKYQWNRKFSDYRALAELLRQMEYLGPAGLVVRGLRAPAFNNNVSVSWINWQFRAIIREAGLPSGVISEDKLEELTNILNAGLLQGQMKYHNSNVNKMRLITERLDKFGTFIYYLGVLIVAVRFGVNAFSFDAFTPKVFNMLSMVIPLFSALAFGLSAQEGFEHIKQSSSSMSEKLKNLSGQSAYMEKDFNVYMRFSQSTADLMLSEFIDWNVFFKSKDISGK